MCGLYFSTRDFSRTYAHGPHLFWVSVCKKINMEPRTGPVSITEVRVTDTWILIVQSEAYEECCALVGFKRIDFKIEMSAGQ